MEYKHSILIIEDDITICTFIQKVLTLHDYNVIVSHTGKDALSMIASHCPDLILLDLGLPDIDGIEIIKKVRSWSMIPIIVVSARTHELDKVTALDDGADDYISKPFGTSELLARIRTSIRHYSKIENVSLNNTILYSANGLDIDYVSHRITLNEKEIHLTPIEYKILIYLAKNAGKVLTYSSIMKHVWGPFTDDNNKILRVNIANIRRKIEPDPTNPTFIYTEVGVGYRMLEN